MKSSYYFVNLSFKFIEELDFNGERKNVITPFEKAQKDYELVLRATKDKDQQAFSDLMDKYKDPIYYMLLKMVNNNDDAEDLTLEAFGKAFNRLNQYTPNFAFSTWLFKIATNNCIDFLRKRRKNVMSIDNRVPIMMARNICSK